MTQAVLFKLPERQKDELRRRSEMTGLSVSELLRRMIDHCCQETVMNSLVPSMSGRQNV